MWWKWNSYFKSDRFNTGWICTIGNYAKKQTAKQHVHTIYISCYIWMWSGSVSVKFFWSYMSQLLFKAQQSCSLHEVHPACSSQLGYTWNSYFCQFLVSSSHCKGCNVLFVSGTVSHQSPLRCIPCCHMTVLSNEYLINMNSVTASFNFLVSTTMQWNLYLWFFFWDQWIWTWTWGEY